PPPPPPPPPPPRPPPPPHNKYIAFLGTVCSFIIFQSFFYEVAGAEEYSLPFMTISLYIFTKYYFTKKEPLVSHLIILGICFAVSVFIRINHFALWLGFCFVIFIEILSRKQWLLLLKYTLCFFAGILVVSIPILLYLRRNNALQDYINQNLFSGGSRAFTGFSIKYFVKSFWTIMHKNFCFMPFVAGFLWIAKKPKDIPIVYAFGFLFSYLLTIFFLAVIRTNFNHYNMILTPFLVPAFAFCIKLIFTYFADTKHKNSIATLLLFLVFAGEIAKWLIAEYVDVIEGIKGKTRNELIAAGKTIDQCTNPGDTILSLGLSCQIYLFTERQPASRYIYQTSGAEYAPLMQEEFFSDLQKNKPAIIAIENNGGYDYLPDWYAPIYMMIEKEYQLLSDENGYYLFILHSENKPPRP
ncbi:MAG: hypothetical protein LBT01_01990, partial [Spirochaetaceae bacterium]|nr:hypothetical protein [Spirochaetaceae bacterium]